MHYIRLKKSLLLITLIFLYPACTPIVKKPVREAGPSVRILIATISSIDSLTFTGSYVLSSEEARYEFGERNKNLYIQPIQDGLRLYNDNRNLLYRKYFPIILEPMAPESRVIYHDSEYTGAFYFQAASEQSVHLINKIQVEEYLKGVVPAEIPTNNYENFEAMKAQAICARTYVMDRLEKNKKLTYDVKSTVADQVFAGYSRQSRYGNQAVDDTKGVILIFNGQPATVFYHSTCGGQLEAAENIWPEINPPYLQGGPDAVSDFYSCSTSPYFRWLETRTIDELDSQFYKNYNHGFLHQTVSDTMQLNFNLQIMKRDSKARVTEIKINYADTSVTLNGYEIRRFFSDKDGKYLPSNLFYMTQSNDSTLVLHGGGYGHGVGMCQFGALNMAKRGFQHYHILSKYFPGTKLIRKY